MIAEGKRAGRAALIGLVGIVVVVIVVATFDWLGDLRYPPLPYRNALADKSSSLTEWNDAFGRARFVDGGYELLVKESSSTTGRIPETQRAEHQHVEVTVVFRRSADHPSDSVPSAGILCRSQQYGAYDFRLGVDGRYAIYRRTQDQDYRELASSMAQGLTPVQVTGAMRLQAQCVGYNPTTLRFFVNGVQVLTADDHQPLTGTSHAGFIVGSGSDRDFAVLFSDFVFRDLYAERYGGEP